MTGQTESVTCTVHNDVLDDTKDLIVFVYKEVPWVCQAWEITQPAITNAVLTTHTHAHTPTDTGWEVSFQKGQLNILGKSCQSHIATVELKIEMLYL